MAKRKATSRSSKPKARAAEPVAEVEVVEEESGSGWEGGVLIVTALILVTAILLSDYANGSLYGEGFLFK